jgi:hypothetical protein
MISTHTLGHRVTWHEQPGEWLTDAGQPLDEVTTCKRCGCAPRQTELGALDECIADHLLALNGAGHRTAASCCGHGVEPPYVLFAGKGPAYRYARWLGMSRWRAAVFAWRWGR